MSPHFSRRVPQSRSCHGILLNSQQVWDRLWRLFPNWVPLPSGSSLPWQLNSLGHSGSVLMDRPRDTSWSEFTQPNHRNHGNHEKRKSRWTSSETSTHVFVDKWPLQFHELMYPHKNACKPMGNVPQPNFYHAPWHDCLVYEEKKTYTNGTKGEQTKSVSTCINSLGSLSQLKCSVLRPLVSRRRNFLENKESPNLSLKVRRSQWPWSKTGTCWKISWKLFKGRRLERVQVFGWSVTLFL